jgi:ribose 5-phosphate isomerase B
MKIAIGSDHAGFDYKEHLRQKFTEQGFEVSDFGAYSTDSADYPDFAHPVAQSVEDGKTIFGILICGSGNGVCITANKHKGVRAALCWTNDLAALARQHNNANVICIPSRFVDLETAVSMAETFLRTEFEGGRHQKRVEKI